jgi:hypothetical protein
VVVRLAELLLRNGIEVGLDQWAEGVRRDWVRWTTDQIMSADFVLVVASPGYRAAAEGVTGPSRARGAAAEAALLREILYRDRAAHFRRILPIVLPGGTIDDIPLFLMPYSADRFAVSELSTAGIEDLLRMVTDQPAIKPPAQTRPTPPRTAHPPRTDSMALLASNEGASPLPDARRSWAVIAGVSHYRELPTLQHVATGVNALMPLFTARPQAPFEQQRTSTLVDPSRSDLLDAVAEAAEQAQDTLLLYFAGHGLVSSRRGDLLLASCDTRVGADYTSVSYDSIRDLLATSRAKRSAVILDCCFSGRALETMGNLDGLAAVPGTFVLTATSTNTAAFAPAGHEFSVFTGALVDVLTNGEPGAGEYLTMKVIHRSIHRRLVEQGFPTPHLMAHGGRELALGRNPADQPRTSKHP